MELFRDQVVLVAGSSGGLGIPVSKAFLEAGATVFGVSLDGQAAEGLGPRFVPVRADLTIGEGARAAVEEVLGRAQRISALVQVMGGFAGGSTVAETDDNTWHLMLKLNLTSAFYMARAVLPHMLAARQGRIVMIGSRTGVQPAAKLGAYAVSKAALITLTQTIAAEVKGTGVTANVVLPSVIDTPANRASDPSADFSRWVKPESIADLLLWLASTNAADVNGAVIPIYGNA